MKYMRIHGKEMYNVTSQPGQLSLASPGCHLCRVAGNTVRSHLAREFPYSPFTYFSFTFISQHMCVYILTVVLLGRVASRPVIG